MALDKVAIRDLVVADLAEIWPEVGPANLLRFWVIVEHGATFSVRPGVDALRLAQRTGADGLYLAGDWTRTSWPRRRWKERFRADIWQLAGGAKSLDQPARLIRPGLKQGWLARWLLGGAEPQLSLTTGNGL